MRIWLIMILLFSCAIAHADGYMFMNKRFADGPVTILQLTDNQKELIELYRSCRNQDKTPYIFTLTNQQKEKLLQESKVDAGRFAIFESFNGEIGIELEHNAINRFSENSFEIPHKLLLPEINLKDWEMNIIGWAPNSLSIDNVAKFKAGICPK